MRGAAPPFRFRLIAALLLVLLWAACLDQAPGPAGPATFDVLDGRPAPAVTQREIERALPSVLRLQSALTNELLALPGVVGTTVAALVEHGGVSVPPGVRVIVTGRFSALDWQAKPQGRPCGKGKNPRECSPGDPEPEPDPTARFDRPVPIGVSTGHPDITAGSIGARVTDGTDFGALSANHVYADVNAAAIGNAVIQPGTFDGGSSPADDIGTLADFEELNISGACSTNPTLTNVMDAAIAATTGVGNATPSTGYGTPESETIGAALKMKVKKFGCTTGQTKGQVAAINAIATVSYGPTAADLACFIDQVIITPGTFSAGGDSGALVVVDGKGRSSGDDRKPVGLLFAGSFTHTIISPIDPILARFSDENSGLIMTIDGSAN